VGKRNMLNKKIIKVKILIKIILIIFTSIIVILNFIPVKISAHIKNIKTDDTGVIICEYDQVTGASWRIIGDSKGLFKKGEGEYIDITGKTPGEKLDWTILLGENNKFILHGKFIGTKEIAGENCRVFEVSHWDIVYPINRTTLRGYVSPKGYLNIYDYWLSNGD
jgi:hypothetical protein